MAYLEKTVITKQGVAANYFRIMEATIKDLKDGTHSCDANVNLFVSKTEFDAGHDLIDNFKFHCVLSDADLDGDTRFIMAQKLMESVLDDDSNETNLIRGNLGEVGLQDAILKQ